MKTREGIREGGAAVLTLALLVAVPLGVRSYERRRVARSAAGAQVVELYASGATGVWSREPLRAWNSFFRHPSKRPIRVKAGVPILLRLTSVDVHHSFSIPQLRVNAQDVTPGRWTEIRLDPQEAGSYTILCYTFCGGRHASMDAELEVL